MGYMRHHAIIVTGYDEAKVAAAHSEAKQIFGTTVTGIVEVKVNDYYSFMVGPDGSKEGWGDSDAGDEARDLFIEWLNAQRYDDGSSPFDWVEVQYGDDAGETVVTRDSDEEPTTEADQ